jgi:hypothetical protein
MAKRRLLKWMQDKLIAHATNTVAPAKEAKALTAAYRKAEPLVRKVVEAKYKPADMAICEKYNLTRRDACVRVQFPSGGVEQFTFTEAETAPLVTEGSCYSRMYTCDEKTAAAIEAWVVARDAFKAEATKRINAYRALVLASANVEDVVAAWPEVANLLPAPNDLIAFDPEQIAILQADQREREAA